MQKREKILLACLLGVVAVMVVLPQIESVLLAPFQSKRATIDDLRSQINDKTKAENRYLSAKRELMDWQADSLPPEPLNAQRVYAEWLVDLARLAGFREIKPSLGAISPAARTYTSITVTLTGEATLQELAVFLFHFNRTRLLQRLVNIGVVSTDTEGNPPLQVSLTAEGLALPNAEPRSRLFARTALAAPLGPMGLSLKVTSASGFPKQGSFRIRIDREFLKVTPRGDAWEVERGVSETAAAAHDAQAIVELAPERPEFDPQAQHTVADFRRLIESSPFAKPRPPIVYKPQLAAIPNQTLIRGTPLDLQGRLTGWDPADGPPLYLLDDKAPPGMEVTDDGRLEWAPAADVPTGDYPVTLTVASALNDSLTLSTAFRVTLRDRNLPPAITTPAALPPAWIGRVWTARVTATDPDGKGPLTFRLGGQPPAGASIDAASGEIRWPLTDATEPGDLPLTVEASDAGSPPQTASATLTVHVQDDSANFTYLVGCIGSGSDWTAWLYDRSTNQSRYLKLGNEFQVADISGKVVSIDLTSMEFEDAAGRWRVVQERPLRQAALLSLTSTDAPAGAGVHGDRPPSPDLPRRAPAP